MKLLVSELLNKIFCFNMIKDLKINMLENHENRLKNKNRVK